MKLLLETLAVFKHLLSPHEHAFSLWREALKLPATLHNLSAHVLFKLLDTR
jgi:hypothetical protein